MKYLLIVFMVIFVNCGRHYQIPPREDVRMKIIDNYSVIVPGRWSVMPRLESSTPVYAVHAYANSVAMLTVTYFPFLHSQQSVSNLTTQQLYFIDIHIHSVIENVENNLVYEWHKVKLDSINGIYVFSLEYATFLLTDDPVQVCTILIPNKENSFSVEIKYSLYHEDIKKNLKKIINSISKN